MVAEEDQEEEAAEGAWARFRASLDNHVLKSGIQNGSDPRGTNIDVDAPAAVGEQEFEGFLSGIGVDPADVKAASVREGEIRRVYFDSGAVASVVWRDFGGRDRPTLEIHLYGRGEDNEGFLIRKRYDPQ